MPRRIKFSLCTVVLFHLIAPLAPHGALFAQSLPGESSEITLSKASLEECLEAALQNNNRRPASRYAVEMAEAQHRQVLASYWPQIGITGGYQRTDEPPNFLFPASTMPLPNGGTIEVTIPGIGVVPVSSFPVPAQDTKLMDEDSFRVAADVTWLLFDGGMRKGYREQAISVVEMMKQESRRTDLEIADSVRRFYYGAVLAAQIHQVGTDTLARMEATLNLTESLYKEGSGRVKKTDWLENKVMVESLRSMVELLESNQLRAQAALANTMGLPWSSSVQPTDKELPFVPLLDRLDNLVSTAYRFNPDWGKVEAGVRAVEGMLRNAKSGYYPRLAVTGELFKLWNDYDSGMATDSNKDGWTVGVGVGIPLFDGFLTKNKVAEARARVAKVKEEQLLLKEGIGLQIRDLFTALGATAKSHEATLEAMKAAEENRDLNTRAHQQELVDAADVVRAQLMEALMTAQHYKARYDHIALLSRLNLVVGTELVKELEGR